MPGRGKKGDVMDAIEQIKRFQEFIELNYYPQLLENIRKGNKFLAIDFAELSKFDPELAADLLEFPEDVMKASEASIKQFDLGHEVPDFRIRFKNIPGSNAVFIKDIRSRYIGKLMQIEGVVRQKSDVRPRVTSARFECPSCSNIMNILQLDESFKEPTKCGCGRKGKFLLLSKELVDAQGLVLEELTESLGGGEQPKRINVFLKDDLVSPLSERKISPGNRVTVVGILKEIPIIARNGVRSTRFDLMLEANYVDTIEETFYELDISEDEERQILDIARDKRCVERLVESLSPSIYGYEKIKESLLIQLVGGLRKVRKDKVVSRGDIHVLLVGDPGGVKSALLKRIATIAPKGRYDGQDVK
ncbi:minichromosome maintenance protein MCM [Candidatus Woesearchaeota archaeon]|nr:minichromosome maintenance protein MCM [Candidatus Woesearchaeota archaeon]